MKRILKNTENLDVTFNEYNINHTIQRILNRLYENDELLHEFYNEVFGKFMIYEYVQGALYEYGDLIWFLDEKPVEYFDGITTLKYKNLHILRCDTNKVYGNLDKYPQYTFESLGWKDLNPKIDILTQFGIRDKLNNYIGKMFKKHVNDIKKHPYGKLCYDNQKNSNYIDYKVAKTDVSNLNPDRDEIFFPLETACVERKENGSIMNGYAQWYDNGLLEYDIVFRLGYKGYQLIDKDYNLSAHVIKANELDFTDIHTDDKYFNTTSDTSIFKSDNEYSADFGSALETNRNSYVNVYSATLNFADVAGGQYGSSLYEFADTNYMIFCSDVLCQNRDNDSTDLAPSPNAMTFCNKNTKSVTAILITYPTKNRASNPSLNSQNTGLAANSFHCHIIGKGKKRS